MSSTSNTKPPAFPVWLAQQLQMRGWSISELARRSGYSHSLLSLVLASKQQPSAKFCAAVADALELSPETVLRHAGIMPSLDAGYLAEENDLLRLFRTLRNPEDRRAVLRLLHGLETLQPRSGG